MESKSSDSDVVDLNILWTFMIKAFTMRSLMVCSTYSSKNKYIHDKNGLVANHAYTVKQVVELTNKVRLLKLRNPWGKRPWNGPWSPGSNEWTCLSGEFKQENELSLEELDGEFYISLQELVRNFKKLNIVHVNLNAFSDSGILKEPNYLWQLAEFRSSFKLAFDLNQNEQFLFKSSSVFLSDEDTSVIISLMQPYSAKLRYANNGKQAYLPIRFEIFDVAVDKFDDESWCPKKCSLNDEKCRFKLVESTGNYSAQREVAKRFCLKPNQRIVIIPSILSNGQIAKCDYLLRVYFNKQICSSLVKL